MAPTKNLANNEVQAANLVHFCGGHMDLYPLAEEYRFRFREPVMAQATGEKRPPTCGEWYLSGAVVEAYQAPSSLGTPFDIARIVTVRVAGYYATGVVPEQDKRL